MKAVHRPIAKGASACALALSVHGVAAIHVATFIACGVGHAAAVLAITTGADAGVCLAP